MGSRRGEGSDKRAEAPEKPELRTGPGGPWTPSGSFNGMVAPLTAFPIKGVIWYQGESNTSPERAPLYDRLFPALIQDWRRAWRQGDFPFFFVQLANFNAAPDSMWPEVRDAQRHALDWSKRRWRSPSTQARLATSIPAINGSSRERLSLAATGCYVWRDDRVFRTLVSGRPLLKAGGLRVLFDHGQWFGPERHRSV